MAKRGSSTRQAMSQNRSKFHAHYRVLRRRACDVFGNRPIRGSFILTIGSPEGTRVLRCRTVASGRLRQVHHIRDVPVRQSVVHPDRLSASEEEANALEQLLSAFGACLSALIHADALARHVEITSLALELSGEVDHAVHWGTTDEPGAIGFEAISVAVHLEADAPKDVLAAIVKRATLWSPVANTLHNPVALRIALA